MTSSESEDNSCAGDKIVAGSGDEAGLAGYIISEFKAQGKVPLQHDVCPASVIPSELMAVVRLDRGGNNGRDHGGSAAEVIGPQADSGKRLHRRPHPEIVHVIESNEIDAIVTGAERLVSLPK